MALWGLAALIVALVFLASRRSSMSWNALPQWLLPDSWRSVGDHTTTVSVPSSSDPDAVPTLEEPGLDEADKTPKAEPATSSTVIPSFSLSDGGSEKEATSVPEMAPPPQFPAANSAQRVSAMAPPPKPASRSTSTSASSLMPPPPKMPTTAKPTPPSAASSLRIPSTGPLPNRGPPVNSQQRASGGLAPNSAVSTPNARGKVLLSPGHSPMDWAALTKSGNLSGVGTFQRVKPSELRSMTGRKGKPAWSSWQGKVYNITPYLPFHPGGEAELMKGAGRDGTKLFMDVHPWVNWENMLSSCLVGVLVPEDYGSGTGQSSLEDMD